ncbi:MAG: M13 family metallopeptidase [Bdellovibrio sp.]|nr:M13 family metallopeptidase [Bdellovibrio sp.]
MKRNISVFVLGVLALNFSAVAAENMSSAIPGKRDFTLDKAVNPCQDFHQYVCNNVEKSFKLRDDRSSHTFAFDDSDERLLEKKKDFFKNIKNEKKLSPRSQQLKDFYLSCMNKPAATKEEKSLVGGLVKDVAKIKTINDFVNLNLENMTNDKWSMASYEIMPNIDDSSIYDMTFDVNFMGLPEHSYYDNKELVVEYTKLMSEFLNTIYPKESKDDHLKRAEAIVNFEKKFKEVYPFPAEFRQRYTQPRKVSRADFLKQTSALKLDSFFKTNVPDSTLLRDFIPESFAFAEKEINADNLQVLKDMYVYRNARGYMDDAYPELFKKRWDFRHKYLGGPISRSDRQERCTMSVMGSFSRELDIEMLPRVFPNFPKEKMEAVAAKIRASIVAGIEKNNWLTKESKKGALEKITTAKLQLVQPTTDREWDFKLTQKFSSTQPYDNMKKLAMAGHKRTFERLREGVNKEAWGMGPLTVNAYYSPDKNKFVLPIGILQYPFFVAEGDLIENLGAVGTVVGHEMGHGIDDEGAKFDASGKLHQWMKDEDIKKFQERGMKMMAQFNKVGHNGALTQGENIADLVGLTFAYNAAFDQGKGSAEDKQKFFVAYGRLWCNVMLDKAKEMQLKTDPHSLGYARINEQVKNQTGFQEAFSCKKGDALYLSEGDRIKIW